MFVVVFEVQPHRDRWDEYLGIAKALKPRLERIDGFIDIDRFSSKRREGRVLSLSIWRDEKSVVRWRTEGEHHAAQERGRGEIFADYRLRVGEVVADTAPPQGLALCQQRLDATETGDAKALTITALTPVAGSLDAVRVAGQLGLTPDAAGFVDEEVFESIYNPGKLLVLAAWRDDAAATAFAPTRPVDAVLRHQRVRVIRDYGMFDRREAPQFYPAAPPRGSRDR